MGKIRFQRTAMNPLRPSMGRMETLRGRMTAKYVQSATSARTNPR